MAPSEIMAFYTSPAESEVSRTMRSTTILLVRCCFALGLAYHTVCPFFLPTVCFLDFTSNYIIFFFPSHYPPPFLICVQRERASEDSTLGVIHSLERLSQVYIHLYSTVLYTLIDYYRRTIFFVVPLLILMMFNPRCNCFVCLPSAV